MRGIQAMSTRWWGKFTFEPGHLRHWQVGTFAMWITRLPREVRLVTRSMPEDAPTRLIPERWPPRRFPRTAR